MVLRRQIPQPERPDRPGVFACEIAIAPENLEEYRTRIEKNAQRGNARGELVVNEIRPAVPDGLPAPRKRSGNSDCPTAKPCAS